MAAALSGMLDEPSIAAASSSGMTLNQAFSFAIRRSNHAASGSPVNIASGAA